MHTDQLRLTLRLDSVISIVSGLAFVALAGLAPSWLGLDATLVRILGVALIPFGAFMAWMGRQERPDPAHVGLVAALDLAWVVGSVYAFVTLPLTDFGEVAVVAVGLMVEGFASAKLWFGFRRATTLDPIRG